MARRRMLVAPRSTAVSAACAPPAAPTADQSDPAEAAARDWLRPAVAVAAAAEG